MTAKRNSIGTIYKDDKMKKENELARESEYVWVIGREHAIT